MKHIRYILALLALTISPALFGQGYSSYRAETTALAGGTYNIRTAMATNLNIDCACALQDTMGVMFSCKSTDTNTQQIVLNFTRSVDGTYFDSTTYPVILRTTANGNTVVTLVTNINTAGYKIMRLVSVHNSNDVAVLTNVLFTYGIKR